MADRRIDINFTNTSGTGSAGEGSASSSANTVIAELKKAIDELALVMKSAGDKISKPQQKKTAATDEPKDSLQRQLDERALKNKEKESRLLDFQMRTAERNKIRQERRDALESNLLRKGLTGLFGAGLINRAGAIGTTAITTNPLANPVARTTSLEKNVLGGTVDAGAGLATAFGGPLVGAAAYGVGKLVTDLYGAFKGVSNQVAYSKYFFDQSYQLRGLTKSPAFNPNVDPDFSTGNAAAIGLAQFTAGAPTTYQKDLVASLGQKLGVNPADLQSYTKLGAIVGQLSKNMGGLDNAAKKVKSYFENYGGNAIADSQFALRLIQSGNVSPDQAFNIATQTRRFGANFQTNATRFATAGYLQRYQKEVLGKAILGVDVRKLYEGTPKEQNDQISKVRALIKGASFSTEGFDERSFFLSSILGIQGRGAITNYKAHALHKGLLNNPEDIKKYDSVTQAAINAQKVIVNATNLATNVAQAQIESNPVNATVTGVEYLGDKLHEAYRSSLNAIEQLLGNGRDTGVK